MPYQKFIKHVGIEKKFCIKNKVTKKITCFGDETKRKTGIRIREAIAHGWVPTGKR